MFPKSWYAMATPRVFYDKTRGYLRVFLSLSIVCIAMGTLSAWHLVPPDYQQGDAFRILYIHVPFAALSLGLYSLMAALSFTVYIWRLKLCDQLAHGLAFTGALFTLLTLLTGSIWGKPMWGTWWIWDARLTSELVLLFFYLGVLLVRQSIQDSKQRAKVASLLTMIGAINLPIIHFSVEWWHSLHQKSTLLGLHAPTMANSMLMPLLPMSLGLLFMACWMVLSHAKISFISSQKGLV